MTSPAAGTGRDRPAIKWLAGYALVAAVVIFAGGVWVVLPEKRHLEQVQRQFNAQRAPPRADSRGLCPSLSAQSGEPGRRLSAGGAAILPAPRRRSRAIVTGPRTPPTPPGNGAASDWRRTLYRCS